MPNVTVLGAGGSTVTVSLTTSENLTLAQQVASNISAANSFATPPGNAVASTNAQPSLSVGQTGELVQTASAVVQLNAGYDYVVNTAAHSIFRANTDAGQSFLSSAGNTAFLASGATGSGTVVAGGGSNNLQIAAANTGNWLISSNSGLNAISALGTGNSTIDAGVGSNTLVLGAGTYSVNTTGTDVILAGAGSETVSTSGAGATDNISVKTSSLYFVGGTGAGASTVNGQGGVVTVYSGTGGGVFTAGSIGGNFFAPGSGADTINLGVGNDTLDFVNGAAGGADTINAFHSGDKIHLAGYGVPSASGTLVGADLKLTLSDGTQVTFVGLNRTLTGSDFG